ncbi:hypothetical protein OKC48_20735 [Methylorubrum extorquens]|uniref:hypothetical protein n=1 Tax=Methylorubrum extorquens TaxID=408 RepID=UPI002238A0C0|nr:hypothetical protein [Methylorubrum extorquens]UYW25674.1 hypothetical protein OKC48_20735 [Methylorubrum extorquens]
MMNPPTSGVTAPLRDMESDVADVERFADLLMHLGSQTEDVPPSALYVVGTSILKLAQRLDAGWTAALEADSKARGISCA